MAVILSVHYYRMGGVGQHWQRDKGKDSMRESIKQTTLDSNTGPLKLFMAVYVPQLSLFSWCRPIVHAVQIVWERPDYYNTWLCSVRQQLWLQH